MALHRGIQSAIFYYVSCAPCADARYRKKRKQEAKRDRLEREALEDELPNLYRHPSPSSTNPHWHAEIALGPTRPRGKRKTTNTADGQAPLPRATMSSEVSGVPSSTHLPLSREGRWDQRMRGGVEQREDEDLWGSTSSLASGLPQRPPKALTYDLSSSSSQLQRTPPVNDMHPAIVTKYESREDVAWMMQPPPLPEVMSGKSRPTTSARSRGSSRASPRSLVLSRQASSISERMLDATDKPTSVLSRQSSGRVLNVSAGQRHDRHSTVAERDFAMEPIVDRETHVPPLPPHNAKEDGDGLAALHRPQSAREPLSPDRLLRPVSRPQLPTILSDSRISYRASDTLSPTSPTSPTVSVSSPSSNSGHRITSNAKLLVNTDGTLYHTHVITTHSPVREVQKQRPPHSTSATIATASHDDSPFVVVDDPSATAALKPEMFDSWYTPDFELPEWVHEHTKREVRERWSMEF